MSDDRDEFDRDDQLRAMLRAADPARSLTPAAREPLARLLEETMDTELRPARRRGIATWVAGAAAAAVVATAGIGAVLHDAGGGGATPAASGHHSPTKPTQPGAGTRSATSAAPQLTTLTAPTFVGRCAAPSADVIAAGTDTAFQGTVTAINGDTVTLQTTSVFRGQVGQTVQVAAPAGLGPLVRSVHFAVGGSYLVSASKGQVALCGFSGRASGNLASLYTEAFPR